MEPLRQLKTELHAAIGPDEFARLWKHGQRALATCTEGYAVKDKSEACDAQSSWVNRPNRAPYVPWQIMIMIRMHRYRHAVRPERPRESCARDRADLPGPGRPANSLCEQANIDQITTPAAHPAREACW
jgi:hypothetical protein